MTLRGSAVGQDTGPDDRHKEPAMPVQSLLPWLPLAVLLGGLVSPATYDAAERDSSGDA